MTKPPAAIQLRIDGKRKTKDAALAGWVVESYELDGMSRGAAERVVSEALAPDAVLELELANGRRILVAAADAERYLGPATARGEEAPGTLEVGQVLRLTGPRAPAGLARDGLGAWIIKGLRIYRQGPAGMTALIAAGTFQDSQLDDRNGLYRCAADAFGLTSVSALPAAAEPSLLFLHGTASSTEGSFGELWKNDAYRARLAKAYGTRLYAFEHRSLTESPIANALTLAKTLPKNARLHLVSHSRGGIVGELLARANRKGAEPFSEDDIERFLGHAKRGEREGYEEDAKRLRELNRELIKRAIRVERFVRVACPARGTTLASGRLDRWASVMLNLFGKGLDAAGAAVPVLAPVAGGYGLLKNFLLAVVKERCDARVLPGLEAMMPESPLVALLNAPGVDIDPPLHVIAGDFDGDDLLPWLGDCLSEVFYGGETDLVVNTPSMSGGAARQKGILQKSVRGPQVTHFSYFERDESALPLLAALEGDDSAFAPLDGPSRATIGRGGRKPKRRDNAPIVLMLPGIMGSHIQIGDDRIWFDPINMVAGEMDRLKVDAAGVSTDGWMDRNYEDLADYLAESHEVRPFAYDWRLSIVDEAKRFGAVLDEAMKAAKERGQGLRIVAHSMGGLVARLALKDRWGEFKSIPGSRLLQLGTPNNGSHSIAAVLMARDDFVQMIERWFDLKHDMKEFLEIVRDFPGVLELLPWPGESGKASDGVDYFDPGTWETWYNEDHDSEKGRCWVLPQKGPLDKARAAIGELLAAGIDRDCTLYVAGSAPTPVAVRIVDGQVEIGWVDQGDGRVPWSTGIPPGVPVWYADAKHGDLANHEEAFEAYRELIETGDTRDASLSRGPRGARGEAAPVFRARSLQGNALYPSADEVLAAAMGGARPGRRAKADHEAPALIEVVHGSPASADAPVLIGAYANDSLRGTAKFMDGHLGGQLTLAYELGRYPARPDDAMVFRHPERNGKPGGAIVVGLGALGELTPGQLTLALTNGLLEHARNHEQCREAPAGDDRLAVSALLVGTGFTGLSIEVGTRCLIEATRRANRALDRAKTKSRIACLTVYEESEDRAIGIALSLRELAGDPRYAAAISFDGRLRTGSGGYRGRCIASGGQPGGYRVHITKDDCGGLRFTVISDRARNEVAAEANQRQAVDDLIGSVTQSTRDQPGLSRALFELMVPNSMKEAVGEVRSLMMSVDPEAATYPWELMRDADVAEAEPLAVRIELVRQLASTLGRGRVPLVSNKRVFVVGDTQSGMTELPGAQAEAKNVAKAFKNNGHEDVVAIYRASASEVYQALFHDRYQFMHFAGHGVVDEAESGLTGMVLGPKARLTSAQVDKLRHVPEFVFINCCHLGDMKGDALPRWGTFAANLASQFIEMGCKAVVAAGWAVDDGAANTFAQTFYAAMFGGKRFGQALLEARKAAYDQHRLSNTWGAYQAYGDERYRFPVAEEEGVEVDDYVHASHVVADLDMLAARLEAATNEEKKAYYCRKLKVIEDASHRPGLRTAPVLEQLGRAWANLGEMGVAIERYRAVLTVEDATAGLRALEQLANLEIRHGAKLLAEGKTDDRTAGEQYMATGVARLQQLMGIGVTVERGSLLASYWKHQALGYHAHASSGQIDDCLANMQRAYWLAAEHSRQRDGEWDYYPLLSALDGAFLIAARGQRKELDARKDQLANLLQAATANARRRFADDRGFFHAVAEIDAARVDALWACFDGRNSAAITDKDVRQQLVAGYRELFRRMGSAREQDSATKQIKFLIALLSESTSARQARIALQSLLAGVAT